MSSRDYIKHLVSNTSPTNTRVGDEYYDPVTNKLYKIIAVNGTTVTNVELFTSRYTFVDVQSPQTITGQKTFSNRLVIANTSTTNTATMTYNASLNSVDFNFN